MSNIAFVCGKRAPRFIALALTVFLALFLQAAPSRAEEMFPDPSCTPPSGVPSQQATMEITGGTWGSPSAQWIDHTNANPPRTSPDATDIVLVNGNVSLNTSATVAGLTVAFGATLTGINGTVTVADGNIINLGTITQYRRATQRPKSPAAASSITMAPGTIISCGSKDPPPLPAVTLR